MHPVENRLFEFFSQHPVEGKIIIAFSGGLDSMSLLHAACRVMHNSQLRAVHVNHQLQPQADDWEVFCEQQAIDYGVSFTALKIHIARPEGNLEAKAREQRYRAFAAIMQPGDVLVTAHHRDDQAETVLLQLMRGAGVDGLSAMAPVTAFKTGRLFRPWLSVSRDQLLTYALDHGLKWIEDPSNQHDRFNRNFIRNRVLPLLCQRWPAAKQLLARSAGNLSQANELVSAQSQADLVACTGHYQHSISIEKLQRLSPARQHFALRQWFAANRAMMPERDQLKVMMAEIAGARHDAAPGLTLSDWQVRRFQGYLYLVPAKRPELPGLISVSVAGVRQGTFQVSCPLGHLSFQFAGQQAPGHAQLSVRFRRAGQAVRLTGRRGTKKLKKLFQEWQVPPWVRDYVPLLYLDNDCVAVADYAICQTDHGKLFANIQWHLPEALDWRLNHEKPSS